MSRANFSTSNGHSNIQSPGQTGAGESSGNASQETTSESQGYTWQSNEFGLIDAILGVAKERGIEQKATAEERPSLPKTPSAGNQPSPGKAAPLDLGRLNRMVDYLEEEIKLRRNELKDLKSRIKHTQASLPDSGGSYRAHWWLRWRWNPPK